MLLISLAFFIVTSLPTSFSEYMQKRGTNNEAKVAIISLGHRDLFNMGTALIPRLALNRSTWNVGQLASGDALISLRNLSDDEIARGIALDGRPREKSVEGTSASKSDRIKFLAVRPSIAEAMKHLGFASFQRLFEKTTANSSEYMSTFLGTELKAGEAVGFIHTGTITVHSQTAGIIGMKNRGQVMTFCERLYIEAQAQSREKFEKLRPAATLDRLFVRVSAVEPLKSSVFNETQLQESRQSIMMYTFIFGNFSLRTSDLNTEYGERAVLEALIATKQLQQEADLEKSPFTLKIATPPTGSSLPDRKGALLDIWAKRQRAAVENNGTITSKGSIRSKYWILHATQDTTRRMLDSLGNASVTLDEQTSRIHDEVLRMTEEEIRISDQQNEIWNIVLATTALLASIVMMTGLSATGFWLPFRIALEIVDLCIGALPGAALLVAGLGAGDLHLTPLRTMHLFVPTPTVVRQATNVRKFNEKIFPTTVLQCSAVGMWRNLQRSTFRGVYIAGVVLGVLVILLDLGYHLRKRRNASAHNSHLEDKTNPVD